MGEISWSQLEDIYFYFCLGFQDFQSLFYTPQITVLLSIWIVSVYIPKLLKKNINIPLKSTKRQKEL
jgi:hypothetical protein